MKMDITIKDVTFEQANLLAKMLQSNALVEGSTVTITRPDAPQVAPVAPSLVTTEQDVVAREEQAADVASGDLDARGFPWNEKIHSGNQEKTAKGLWTKRRGVDQATVDQVEAEMRASGWGQVGGGHPIPPVAPQQAPVQAAPVAPAPVYVPQPAPVAYAPAPVQPVAYAPAPQQPVYAPAPQQAPVQAAPVAPAPVAQDYSGLMQKIGQLFNTGAITPDYLNSLTQRISAAFQTQVNAITDIGGNPQMVGYAFQLLAADGK